MKNINFYWIIISLLLVSCSDDSPENVILNINSVGLEMEVSTFPEDVKHSNPNISFFNNDGFNNNDIIFSIRSLPLEKGQYHPSSNSSVFINMFPDLIKVNLQTLDFDVLHSSYRVDKQYDGAVVTKEASDLAVLLDIDIRFVKDNSFFPFPSDPEFITIQGEGINIEF